MAFLKFNFCCGPDCCQDAIDDAKNNPRGHCGPYCDAVKLHLEDCLDRHIDGLGLLNSMRYTQQNFAPPTIDEDWIIARKEESLAQAFQNRDAYTQAYRAGRGLKDFQRDALTQYLYLRREALQNPRSSLGWWTPDDSLLTDFRALDSQPNANPLASAEVGFGGEEMKRGPERLQRLFDYQRRECPAYLNGVPTNVGIAPAAAPPAAPAVPPPAQGRHIGLPLAAGAPQPAKKKKRGDNAADPTLGDAEDPPGAPGFTFGGGQSAFGQKKPFTYPGSEPNQALLGSHSAPQGPGLGAGASPAHPYGQPASKKARTTPRFLDQAQAQAEYERIRFELVDIGNLPVQFESQNQAAERILERRRVLDNYNRAIVDIGRATTGNGVRETHVARNQAIEAVKAKDNDYSARAQQFFPGNRPLRPAPTQTSAFAPSQGADPTPQLPRPQQTYPPGGNMPATSGQSGSSGGQQGPMGAYGGRTSTTLGLRPPTSPGLPPFHGGGGLKKQLSKGSLRDGPRGRSKQKSSVRESGNSQPRPTGDNNSRTRGHGNDSRSGSAHSDISVHTKASTKSSNKVGSGAATKSKKPKPDDKDERGGSLANMFGGMQLK